MKQLILGHGQHGKDTFAALLEKHHGYTFQSSSLFACEKAVLPHMDYETVEACYAARHNNRLKWKSLISEYNTPDKARLCKELLEYSDIYVGMRCNEEYLASRDLFDVIYFVDAFTRRPRDPSMAIKYDPAKMIYVDNCGTLEELEEIAKRPKMC